MPCKLKKTTKNSTEQTREYSQWATTKKKHEKKGKESLHWAEMISGKSELPLLGFLYLASTQQT